MLSREGKPVDFTYCSITQYGAETVQTTFPTFSALLDAFYTEARPAGGRAAPRA